MIVRSIAPALFSTFLKDFAFLFQLVRDSNGEIDLRLRENYFNLYYKGNSLAAVFLPTSGRSVYKVRIHQKFTKALVTRHQPAPSLPEEYLLLDARFTKPKVSGSYLQFELSTKLLHSFFSKSNLQRLAAAISQEAYGEEISFEHVLITDNLNRSDFFIIDRQITGGPLGTDRMDLLALVQDEVGSPRFHFVILEVKLGKNPELREQVGTQLQRYIQIVEMSFSEFKRCYELTYEQMHKMRILTQIAFPQIEIVLPVKGCVVVGGYSGLAENALTELKQKWPDIKVIKMFHLLQMEQLS